MTKYIFALILAVSVAGTTIPVQAATYTVTNAAFDSMSTDEKIAYLYGMISQLQLLLLIAEDTDDYRIGVARPLNTRDRSDIDVETLSATDISEDEAELRARIDLNGEDKARVWFEYGEDDDDLDDRTSRRRVTDSGGDNKTIYATITGLDEDERYYYRAVAEDEDGDEEYGSIRSFTTDDRRSVSRSSGDFDLDLSDTSIEEGEEVVVYWEVPRSDIGARNWIGLYEVGDDNDEYVSWSYIAYDDEGDIEFEIEDEGEYEFRLFLDNSNNDEITSREVSVY